MREIKFRARGQVGRKIWYYGLLTSIGENVCHIKDENIMHEYICDTDTLGQYTGLKDRNGKEIYEGDIVKSILILDNGIKLRTNIDIVEWNDEECSFMLTKNVRHFHNNLELKVIGNIYENPELLEVIE